MRAVTWHGKRDVRVDEVPDPVIEDPTDVIVEVTSTGICGSDLHLYEVLGPLLDVGDILGHEAMGVIAEVGPAVTTLQPGDRVVVPFNVSCQHCFMCDQGLHSQCETTQVREQGSGAALFGYTKLYGQVRGGQAEYLRVPFGDTLPVKVPHGPPDDRFVYLSDVLPTAWQAVHDAGVPAGGSLAVLGLGAIGDMCTRIAHHLGVETVIGVDRVPEPLARAAARGTHTIDSSAQGQNLETVIRELTDGRGTDGVIDAVGMEKHGSPGAQLAHFMVGLLPDVVASPLMKTIGIDRMATLHTAVDLVRRGGTSPYPGCTGAPSTPCRYSRCSTSRSRCGWARPNVYRWVPDLLPLLTAEDPLEVDDFATHRLPLACAPQADKMFQVKDDGMVKTLLHPGAPKQRAA